MVLSLNFCLFAQVEEKSKLLRDAINYHSKITVEALMGRVLTATYLPSEATPRSMAMSPTSSRTRVGTSLPWFIWLLFFSFVLFLMSPSFKPSPAYQLLNTNILSTSTLASPAIMGGAFGPVAQEGYA